VVNVDYENEYYCGHCGVKVPHQSAKVGKNGRVGCPKCGHSLRTRPCFSQLAANKKYREFLLATGIKARRS
jgi:DNA-directed RNA polymerase subunit RPC12/RpoP